MILSIKRPDCACIERPSALITPAVTLASNPSGFPIAITSWPTRKFSELANRTCASIRQVYTDGLRIVDNVAVSQNKSIRRDDEAGAVPADFALATSCLHALCYLDVNYRRCDTRNRSNHRPRICIEQIRVVRLHFATNKLCSASVGLIEKKIDRISIIFRRSC